MWIESHKALNALLYIVLCCTALGGYQIYALLYPPTSVIQLVGSISVPVINLPPSRRIAFDWGFQMNYDLPFALSSFYNVPIWSITNGSRIRSARHRVFRSAGIHPHDFTVIELYKGVEDILESYGYGSSCLQLSICDLMRFPFDKGQRNFLSDFISLFLRPSRHLNLGRMQFKELKPYLLAELRGNLNLDCTGLYVDCPKNPLNLFSIVFYGGREL